MSSNTIEDKHAQGVVSPRQNNHGLPYGGYQSHPESSYLFGVHATVSFQRRPLLGADSIIMTSTVRYVDKLEESDIHALVECRVAQALWDEGRLGEGWRNGAIQSVIELLQVAIQTDGERLEEVVAIL